MTLQVRTFLFVRGARFDVVLCSFVRWHGGLTFTIIFEQIDGLARVVVRLARLRVASWKGTVLSLIERT
jgi:hypothetical protein